MRVALTGCAGFIGSQLAQRLLGQGHEVAGLDCFDDTLYPVSRHEQQLAPCLGQPRFQFLRADLLDEIALQQTLRGADVVVHLAALAGVRPSLSQARRYFRSNVEGTQAVLDACAALHIGRVVVASSSSVYGARSTVPFHEDDPVTAPASPYAASKRACELLCSTHASLHPAAVIALRFFTVFGPWQRPDMAIAKFAALIQAEQPVPLFGSGQTARDYTYVEDILDGIEGAIARTAQPVEPFRIYNLGGHHTTPLARLVDLLEQALGKKAQRQWLPAQPGDVPLTCADITRAQSELAYQPKISVEEGIRRYTAWLAQTAAT